jgi:hypothetical protein
MQNRLITVTLSALLFIGLVSFIDHAPVYAQAATNAQSSGQALEIGPPVINLSADPGQTIKTTISIRDISNTNLLVKGQVNDFVADGEDGTPKILLDANEVSPYSLKGWLSTLPDMVLKPKEVHELPISISVPSNASPGGYYGIVRFTGTPPDLNGTGISLSASLGSLILMTVNGNATHKLSVAEFSVNHNGSGGPVFESAPLKFVTRLSNSGNIHETPSGLVTITDMFGHQLATLSVNQPARDILPGSIRKFETSLDNTNIGNKVLFGKYTAVLSLDYGTDQKVNATITFWVIPYTLIIIVLIGLIVGFFGIRYLIRRYNQHIMGKARPRR